MKKMTCQGSFTVEAALVIPFCFFVLMSLFSLFQSIVRQNNVQMGMLQAAQAYSCQEGRLSSLEIFSKNGVVLQWNEKEDSTLCFTNYTIEIPFLGSRLCKLNRYQQMAVSNYKGISMIPEESGEEIVYLAENGQVYHRNRECTYLRIIVQTVTLGQSVGLRNQSGGKYYPCEGCCKGRTLQEEDTVYLTSYGDRYHWNKTCSKLKRTVREVYRSEVGNLPACSKCG